MNAQRKTRNRKAWKVSTGVCPLCERAFPRAELVSAIRKEAPGTRRTIVTAIRQKFPSWTQESGACRECWESFRGVARVRNFMKKFKFPRA